MLRQAMLNNLWVSFRGFPDVYEPARDLLKDDNPVVVLGYAERVSEIILRSLQDDKITFSPHRNILGINSADLNSSLSYQTR